MEKYKVPAGLRPLLEALARETLRAQPTDLLQFGQLFFDVLQHHKMREFFKYYETFLFLKFYKVVLFLHYYKCCCSLIH